MTRNTDFLKSDAAGLTPWLREFLLKDDESENSFFFPNMCHVCHCFGEDVSLKRCSACKMISYCSVKHQEVDWPVHKEFCKAIVKIKKTSKLDNVFQTLKHIREIDLTSSSSAEKSEDVKREFKTIMENLTLKIMQVLGRKLKSYEAEMIIYPRICAVCFESAPELLTNCKKCPEYSFCKDHLDYSSHEEECRKLVTIFYVRNEEKHISELGPLARRIQCPVQHEDFKLPSSMINLFETCLSTKIAMRSNFPEGTRTMFEVLLSEVYSMPLTLVFAMMKLNLNVRSLVIHLLGVTNEEQILNNWESIFHFVPKLRELKLILIGSELSSNSSSEKNICDICTRLERKLIIETKNCEYEKYAEKNFQKPDVIAAFNRDFNNCSSWKNYVEIISKFNCPLIITSLNKKEGFSVKSLVQSQFPCAKCVYFDYNPFASFLYMRVGLLTPTCTKNEFMLIYKDFDPERKND